MKQFHVICGLPRSGSTLLCNILNQNPEFTASSTSGLCYLLHSMREVYSNSPEYKSLAINNQEETESRIKESMVRSMEAWHPDDRVIFDKSRLWLHHANLLRALKPESKIIITVRDLRDIFASIASQDIKNPLWNIGNNTLTEKADEMFSDSGVIGQSLRGVYDIVNRKIPQVLFIKFGDFVSDVNTAMAGVHDFIGLDHFDYDFDNIKDTATDIDALYGYKFPHHNHSGEIRPPVNRGWESVISDNVAEKIVELFPDFFKIFKY